MIRGLCIRNEIEFHLLDCFAIRGSIKTRILDEYPPGLLEMNNRQAPQENTRRLTRFFWPGSIGLIFGEMRLVYLRFWLSIYSINAGMLANALSTALVLFSFHFFVGLVQNSSKKTQKTPLFF